MKRFNNPASGTRTTGLAIAVVSVGIFVSACTTGGESRGFDVPKALCGTPVSPELLDPVLPKTGEKVTEQLSDDIEGIRRCRLSVDGKVALSASTEWWGEGTRVTKVASSQAGVLLDEHVSKDGHYTYAEKGGVARVTCPDPAVPSRREDGELFATVFITDEGTPNESAMKDLVVAFADAAGKSEGCTGGN